MKKEHAKQRKHHSFTHLCSTDLLTMYTCLDYCSKYYNEYCSITEKKKNTARAVLEFTREKMVGRGPTCRDYAEGQAQGTRSEEIACARRSWGREES